MPEQTETTKLQRGWFKVIVSGEEIAGGIGPYEMIKREADHYALMYRDDGKVRVRVARIGERKRQ